MCGSTVVTLLWIRDTAPLSTPCVDVDVDLYESEFEGVCGSYQRKMDPFLKKKLSLLRNQLQILLLILTILTGKNLCFTEFSTKIH